LILADWNFGMPVENACGLEAKPSLRIAVLIPCYNEAAAIAQVVHVFKASVPSATVYVYDNNSSDQSMERAAAAGAVVRNERHQGKGHVVRRMFADIDADVYVMVDGDATYDPTVAPHAVADLVDQRLDFINIARRSASPDAYRSGHQTGNALLTRLVGLLFGREFTDMLSGYKVSGIWTTLNFRLTPAVCHRGAWQGNLQ
jgi:glycosyltransferase involved in cell wall biosynthesis